ncbi:MAG: cbb3-type cytochrome oxidase assembly protein CcoS [Bacteroidetes bacterium]|nr:cbb3-type cytochrome oxidase assembly protein CcoS [Bacteroidota bacterium]
MQVIVVLIGFSLLVAVGFLIAFLWAVKSGQYDDDVSPAMRMLHEDRVLNKALDSNSIVIDKGIQENGELEA